MKATNKEEPTDTRTISQRTGNAFLSDGCGLVTTLA